jgi:hypothetical protein
MANGGIDPFGKIAICSVMTRTALVLIPEEAAPQFLDDCARP